MPRLGTYLILLAVVVLAGCGKKDVIEIPSQTLTVGNAQNVRDVIFFSEDVGFACGGWRDREGYIWRTQDGGQTWAEFKNEFDLNIYSLYFVNANVGFAGGDFMHYWKTTDGGDSWQIQWFGDGELAYHEVHRPAIRKFEFVSDSVGHLVGGENYEVGVVYRTFDQGNTWYFDTIRHELRGIDFYDDARGVISGFGYVATTNDGGNTYQQQDIKGDFYVSIKMRSYNTLVAASANGGIYRSNDFGVNWDKIVKPNKLFRKRRNFNDMKFYNSQIGYAVGPDGYMMRTWDGGDSWEVVSIGTESDLHRISYQGDKAYVAGQQGEIYVFDAQ